MNRKTKRRQKGAAYIGQGASGCGFFPGFRCKGETLREKSIFTKLMTTEAAEHEIETVKHIKRIDPDMKFSIYPYKMCHPSEEDLGELLEEGLLKCSLSGIQLDNPIFLKEQFEKKNIALLQQKYGGKSLESLIQFARKQNMTNQNIYRIFYIVANVFKGLTHYHNNDIVHFDVKPDNIVFNSSSSYLIDFGISFDLKKYVPGDKYYNMEFPFYSKKLYEFYPFDSIYIKKWSRLFNDKGVIGIDKEALISFWKQLKEFPYMPEQQYMGEFYDDYFIPFTDEREYKEMYENIFSNLLTLNDNNKTVLKPKIRNYLFKQIDVYSLGISLCRLTYALTKKIINIDGRVVKAKEYGSTSSVPDEIVEDLYVLSMKMMHPDPLTRLSSPAALNQYAAILKKIPLNKGSTKSSNKVIDALEASDDGFDPYLILQSLLDI